MENTNKNRKEKKKSKKSVFTIFMTAGACVFISFMLLNHINVSEREQKSAELDQSITQQQIEIKKAANEIKNSDDAEYIERIAREKYGYVHSGDRVYVNTK